MIQGEIPRQATIVVVTGVPVRSPSEELYGWFKLLLFVNILYFIFTMFEEYHREQAQIYSIFAFIVYGLYLPIYGCRSSKLNKSLVIYGSIQICLSLMSAIGVVSSMSFYFSVKDTCNECQKSFDMGNVLCDAYIQDVQIDKDICSSIPTVHLFILSCVFNAIVNVIGIVTGLKARNLHTNQQKEIIAHIVQQVPFPMELPTPVQIEPLEPLEP